MSPSEFARACALIDHARASGAHDVADAADVALEAVLESYEDRADDFESDADPFDEREIEPWDSIPAEEMFSVPFNSWEPYHCVALADPDFDAAVALGMIDPG